MRNQQEDGSFDNDQLAWTENDAERNDQSGSARGRMAGIEKNHQCPGSGKRKRGGENSRPEDPWMNTKRHSPSTGDDECPVTTDNSDRVTENCISRAGRFCEGREEEEIGSRSEGRENKRIAAEKRQKRKHSNGDEAVYKHVD